MTKSIYTKEYKKVIERLKKARQESGLKQIEVVKKLGKPQSYISKVEKGERRVDIIELKKIADIYKKSLDYFVK
jgi:transcriptional regulator with XRE-family HTH domain